MKIASIGKRKRKQMTHDQWCELLVGDPDPNDDELRAVWEANRAELVTNPGTRASGFWAYDAKTEEPRDGTDALRKLIELGELTDTEAHELRSRGPQYWPAEIEAAWRAREDA